MAQSCERQQGVPPCRASTRGFWHQGLLASEGSGGQVCGAEVQEPDKETHNP